jgi:hypothetical protein
MARAKRDAVEKLEGHEVEIERPRPDYMHDDPATFAQKLEDRVEERLERLDEAEPAPAADPQPEGALASRGYLLKEEVDAALADPQPEVASVTSGAIRGSGVSPELQVHVDADFFKAWVRREIAMAASGVDEETRKNLNP